MAYYNLCERCGSNLDPGERCDCVQEVVMVHNGEDTEDIICEIIKNHPNTTTTGIVTALKKEYGMTLAPDSVRKFVNRLMQFGGVRAEKSSTGAVVYSLKKEA